jgi:HEAT repeat protein
MDKFVMFAVTCTHATLDELIEILEKENEAVRERAEEGMGYTRNLKVTVFLRALQHRL